MVQHNQPLHITFLVLMVIYSRNTPYDPAPQPEWILVQWTACNKLYCYAWIIDP